MYIELESGKMAKSRFESMNEEEIAHLLDDKNSKNTKKNRKRQVACFLKRLLTRRESIKSYNSRGIGDCFAKILLLL